MRLLAGSALCLLVALTSSAADTNFSTLDTSHPILPSTFKPPQDFRNVNVVRSINLDKGYTKEVINVVIENVGSSAQDEYFLSFDASVSARVGGLEVRDKKAPDAPPFEIRPVGHDDSNQVQFYRISLPRTLGQSQQQTLTISYYILAALTPLPEKIKQVDKQYLQHNFNAYIPSAYPTSKQKTKIKFPNAEIPEYTIFSAGTNPYAEDTQLEDPQKQGSSFTYGPYSEVPAGAHLPVSVLYEFTKPLNHAELLERDLEVSHWGGNLATEERYWLSNRGAALLNHFSRVQWATSQYYNPPTSALKELKMPLKVGSTNPYFVDDIGNVSTSRFRSNVREAMLELRPRYPVFGNWRYKFKVGWDQDIKSALRHTKGEGYVLRVPFFEGPKQAEGIEYEKVVTRVILPEGATNVNFETTVPIVSSEMSIHRTFMDTIGRPTLKLTAVNLVDELSSRELIVTYDYPFAAGFRKPLVFMGAIFSLFCAAWLLTRVDVSIGKKVS